MTESEIFEFFHNLGIVPVVKIDDAAKAEKLAEAMIKGGNPCAEVTFRTDAAEEAIRRMTTAFPEMIVGAGTVLNKETAERAVKAGAKFIVSPGLDEGTVRWCQENGIPVDPTSAFITRVFKARDLVDRYKAQRTSLRTQLREYLKNHEKCLESIRAQRKTENEDKNV